ncbi:hypothetical protein GXP71_00435 [Cellulomonas sp. H30R-01]|uniref:AHH domain-containing protein n=1 Tax=Cellulomonas sp. H30R-01 TaxID=2704467 RepID=UPI00138D9366|nr:AHH domain-containing protein [Cellulomonas sp. H30R-01]QHT54717.1 hypothetical protein GXP71_00435 [Cellulomonas sp. H30R-01]
MAPAATADTGTVGGLTFHDPSAHAETVAVAIAGWFGVDLHVSDGGPTGLLPEPEFAPGWVNGDNVMNGLTSSSGSGWNPANIQVTVDHTPEFGATDGTFSFTGSISGSCDGEPWTNQAVRIQPFARNPDTGQVQPLYFTETFGNLAGDSLGRNCGGPLTRTDSQVWTGTRGGAWGTGTPWTFSHVEVSILYSRNQTGEVLRWYPEGHALRPETPDPGSGTVTQTLECIDANGHTQTVTADTVGTLTPGAVLELPDLLCPEGSVTAGFGATWRPSAGQEQQLIPETESPSWVTEIPSQYPQCLTTTCYLQLSHLNEDGTPTSCGPQAEQCPNWYIEASRAEDYMCKWGPYPVDLNYCSVFREPGRVTPNAELDDNGNIHVLLWPPLSLESAPVATLRSLLVSRYGDENACSVLGEKLRSFASSVAVPDAVLVCDALGIQPALRFAAATSTSGPGAVFMALLDAVLGTEPTTLEPDCANLREDGVCLDDQTVVVDEPTPDPDPAGGGVSLPPNCIEDAAAAKILRDAWNLKANLHIHHLATNKGNSWAPIFKAFLAANYPTLNIDADWNKLPMLQSGNHSPKYHRWVYNAMIRAKAQAGSDADEFTRLFKLWVKEPIRNADPLVLGHSYWKCR